MGARGVNDLLASLPSLLWRAFVWAKSADDVFAISAADGKTVAPEIRPPCSRSAATRTGNFATFCAQLTKDGTSYTEPPERIIPPTPSFRTSRDVRSGSSSGNPQPMNTICAHFSRSVILETCCCALTGGSSPARPAAARP